MLRRLLARVMILFLTFAVVAVVTGMPQKSDEADAGQPTQITRYIIGLNAPMDAGVKDAVKGAGGKLKHDFSQWNMISADLPDNAIKGLSKNPKIKYIKEAVVVSATEDTLDWGVDRIDAEKVWGDGEDAVDVTKSTTGNGVKVAILDTGIDIDHSDLAGNVKGGWNIIADNSDFDDPNGHGTHCAGIVAAADNGFGVIGVAPEAHLYGVKVLDRRGRGTEDDVAAGILWAIENEMDIVSMSLGADVPMEPVGLACTAADDAGVLLVAAAGNDYEAGEDTVDYPGAYPEVIAVAGTDTTNKDNPESGTDYKYSNSSTGPEVEIAAPAVSILSTYSRNRYAYASGTSMATPMVAGTAALVMDANPGISSAEVRSQLSNTAEDLGDPGWDQVFGNGLVDAEAAVGTVDASPTVSISSHEDGDIVSNPVIITAQIVDEDAENLEVIYQIDGSGNNAMTHEGDGIYEGTWNPNSSYENEEAVITVVATDDADQTGSDTVTVIVDNDYESPSQVAVTSPQDGSTVSGTIEITATAVDDIEVTKVEFYIDGIFFAFDTTIPYSVPWNTIGESNEEHAIKVVAHDGYTTTDSPVITVTVDNPEVESVSIEPIDYNAHGGKDNDRHLDIIIRVVQTGTSIGVEGAEVTALIKRNGASEGDIYSGTTGSDGSVVIYKERNVPYGMTYSTEIQSIIVNGSTWDGVQNDGGYEK